MIRTCSRSRCLSSLGVKGGGVVVSRRLIGYIRSPYDKVLCSGKTLSSDGTGDGSGFQEFSGIGKGSGSMGIFAGPLSTHMLMQCGESRTLYGVGRNVEGQLGGSHFGSVVSHQKPTEVYKYLDGDDLTGASCGSYHSLIGLGGSRVLCLGRNEHGELGSDDSQDTCSTICLSDTSTGTEFDICQLVAGTDYSLALNSSGKVFAWGRNKEGQLASSAPIGSEFNSTPKLIPGLNYILQIAGGWGHCLALSAMGQVYSWGSNYHGQLGNGKKGDFVEKPQLLRLPLPFALAHQKAPIDSILVKPLSVSCGGSFSVMMTEDLNIATLGKRRIFTWGSHKDDKLGFSDCDEDILYPSFVKLPGDSEVKDVSVGCDHTIVLDYDRNLWGWGFPQHLALGDNRKLKKMDVPTLLRESDKANPIEQILCSQDETVLSTSHEEEDYPLYQIKEERNRKKFRTDGTFHTSDK